MREQELSKIEFLMTCNDDIIVQRFFNVRDFNENSFKSVELLNYLSGLSDFLKNELKLKSNFYLLDNEYEIMTDPNVLSTDKTDSDEMFNLILKKGDKIMYHIVFDAKLYPPKVRYSVDIRPHLKTILYDLTSIMSDTNLTYELDGYKLV